MNRPEHRPWIIAHRGASRAAPGNTIEAFRIAAEMGADAVELDVRRTADGEIVVHHDDSLPKAGPIVELSHAEIRRAAPYVPTLAEALDACRGMWVNIEVKNSPVDRDWDPDDTVLGPLLDRVDRSGHDGATLVSSFNPGTVARAKRLGVRTGWLVAPGLPSRPVITQAAGGEHTSVHPHVSALQGESGERLIETAHEAGLQVICWTLDDPDEQRRLSAFGIDGIITNRPDEALQALEGSES